jgi:hypothetical protein
MYYMYSDDHLAWMPSYSGLPVMRFMFCMHCVAAP